MCGKMQNAKQMIKITGCSDPMMWYRGMVGEYVPFIRKYDDCYLSRDSGGFTNIIRLDDGELVDISKVEEENRLTATQQEVLDLIQEECAELIQAISKVRRFGKKDNMEQLCTEFDDLTVLMQLAEDKIPEVQEFDHAAAQDKKLKKLQVYSNIFKS